MASNAGTLYVRLKLGDTKAMAILLRIAADADAIIEDQPWNGEAKRIKKLASQLLNRLEMKKWKK